MAKNSNKKQTTFLYKKLIRLRENVQSLNKIFKFKKKKWQKLQFNYRKKLRFYKKFKPYDQNKYQLLRFASIGNSFQKRFRNTLIKKKKNLIFFMVV